MLHGPRCVAKFCKHHAKICLSQRIRRIETDGALEMEFRVLRIPLIVQDNAEIIVNFGVPWIEAESVLKMRSGGSQLSLICQQHAEKNVSRK